jgi:XisI protein
MAVEKYRQYIQEILTERAQHTVTRSNPDEYEIQTLFDVAHDHYQLLHVGWYDNHRVFSCSLHLDIRNGQIWIQEDSTEEGIANRLVELGVPRGDIVLAFHEPSVRQYTDFATGKERSLQLQV